MSQEYKGWIIGPTAFESEDGTGWRAEVEITEVDDETDVGTVFQHSEVFPTEKAALSAALTVGKNEVDKAIKSNETNAIRSVIEQQTQLPSTHRRGLGHRTDDVAMDTDGPRKVPGPENPEDRFD